MKKTGILNSQLSGMIAALGHKDLVMIGDAGMPPPGRKSGPAGIKPFLSS